jgi:hypothetical protein
VEATTLFLNPSGNPAFERLLQIADDICAVPAGQMATLVTGATLPTRIQIQTRLSPSDSARLCSDYQAGATLNALASKYRVHKRTASAVLERAGVARRSYNTGPSDEAKSLAVELYDQGHSTAAIGAVLGFSSETIRSHLIKTGITLRPRRGWR